MQPNLTLHHFTHPQWFDEIGAFQHEENIPIFAEYAVKMVQLFGNKVKMWATFNEPTVSFICWCMRRASHQEVPHVCTGWWATSPFDQFCRLPQGVTTVFSTQQSRSTMLVQSHLSWLCRLLQPIIIPDMYMFGGFGCSVVNALQPSYMCLAILLSGCHVAFLLNTHFLPQICCSLPQSWGTYLALTPRATCSGL